MADRLVFLKILLKEVAKKHKLKIIEDCAQAQGAEFNGVKVGNFGAPL